jgi:hypothetical protein
MIKTESRVLSFSMSVYSLGHLLNPKDPDDDSTRWIHDLWQWILEDHLGLDPDPPSWLDRPALSRITASSPAVLRWFDAFNEGKDFSDRIKPANFLLLAHPDPLDPSPALPIAPYEPDASRWLIMDWFDRRNGEQVTITTAHFDGMARPGVVRVRTYRDIVSDYLRHPEAKSLAPGGGPVKAGTRGLLRRRPVQARPVIARIGKEANRIEERMTGVVTKSDDYLNEYVDPHAWRQNLDFLLSRMTVKDLAAALSVDRGTVGRWRSGKATPHSRHAQQLAALVIFQPADVNT